MSRHLEILARPSDSREAKRYFSDKEDHVAIQCAFDLDKDCSPNCAACETREVTCTHTCKRGNFLIGMMKSLSFPEK